MGFEFARARAVIDDAIAARVFPGATVEVGRRAGAIASWHAGTFTYDADAPPVTSATIYDLASLTKVLSTAALALQSVERGDLAIDDPVSGHVVGWASADRLAVTIGDLLEHAAGLPAHRKYYETFAGSAAFEAAICAEPLEYLPRTQALYTDLGFMLLGFILADVTARPLDAAFDRWRSEAIGDVELCFRPPDAWRARTAPTEFDPWRGRILAGEVHDENAAALGGAAGHAGLFGTCAAVGACARWWLDQLALSPTAQRFAVRSSVPGSSRALAWDTMLPTSSCGTRFSSSAIGHTGFTGTSLWIDPARDLYVAFLSNRVHPSRSGDGIQAVRRALHDAVMEELGTL